MNRLRYLWLTLTTRSQRRRGRAALAAAAAIHKTHRHTCGRADSLHLSQTERETWLLIIISNWSQEEFGALLTESAKATPERRPR